MVAFDHANTNNEITLNQINPTENQTHNDESFARKAIVLGSVESYTIKRFLGEISGNSRNLNGDDKYLTGAICDGIVFHHKEVPLHNQPLELSYTEIAKFYNSQDEINRQHKQLKNPHDKTTCARDIGKKVKHLNKSMKKLGIPIIQHIPPINPKGKKGKKDKSKWRLNILNWVHEILSNAKNDNQWQEKPKEVINKLVIQKVKELKTNIEKQVEETIPPKNTFENKVNKLYKKINSVYGEINQLINIAQNENIDHESIIQQLINPILDKINSNTNNLLNSFDMRTEAIKANTPKNGYGKQNNKEDIDNTSSSFCYSVYPDIEEHYVVSEIDTPQIVPYPELTEEQEESMYLDNTSTSSCFSVTEENNTSLDLDTPPNGTYPELTEKQEDFINVDNGMRSFCSSVTTVNEAVIESSENRVLNFVYFYNVSDNEPKIDKKGIRVTWKKFETFLANPRIKDVKDGLAYSFAKYDPAKNVRNNKNVVGLDALTLDVDNGSLDSYLEVCNELGCSYAYHTTFSYDGDKSDARFRLIFPFSRTLTPASYQQLWAKVVKIFSSAGLTGIDESCKDLARMFYFPTKNSEQSPYEHSFFDNADFVNELVSYVVEKSILKTASVNFCKSNYVVSDNSFNYKDYSRMMPDYDYFSKNPRYTSKGAIDRSWHDVSFAATAIKRNFSDDAIIDELKKYSEKYSSKGDHGERYLAYIVKSAKKMARV